MVYSLAASKFVDEQLNWKIAKDSHAVRTVVINWEWQPVLAPGYYIKFTRNFYTLNIILHFHDYELNTEYPFHPFLYMYYVQKNGFLHTHWGILHTCPKTDLLSLLFQVNVICTHMYRPMSGVLYSLECYALIHVHVHSYLYTDMSKNGQKLIT